MTFFCFFLGVSTIGGAFNKAVCEAMARINDVPLIFALSNPSSKEECTAQQAYEWTNGTCGKQINIFS